LKGLRGLFDGRSVDVLPQEPTGEGAGAFLKGATMI